MEDGTPRSFFFKGEQKASAREQEEEADVGLFTSSPLSDMAVAAEEALKAKQLCCVSGWTTKTPFCIGTGPWILFKNPPNAHLRRHSCKDTIVCHDRLHRGHVVVV